MPKPSAASTSIYPFLALAFLCWLSPGVGAQKSPATVTGAPLKGVDVRLARYAGAQFSSGGVAAATRTDENGNFTFPVLPRGEYMLTVGLSQESDSTPNKADRGGYNTPAAAGVRFCYITVNLPDGKTIEMGYDLKQNKAFDSKIDPTKESTSKFKAEPIIIFSDGKEPCNGTIVKSKSNIKNN